MKVVVACECLQEHYRPLSCLWRASQLLANKPDIRLYCFYVVVMDLEYHKRRRGVGFSSLTSTTRVNVPRLD